MTETREYARCAECGGPVVHVRSDKAGATIHSFPDSEPALMCRLNPLALPRQRAG